jgi:GntR family transcriptional regulator
LKPDEKLPSVRELASMIRINPNTIQKAYKYLEEDNYIYSVKGVGNFVKDADELRDLHIKNTKDELFKVIESLKELGLRDERIVEMVKEMLTPSAKGGSNVNNK